MAKKSDGKVSANLERYVQLTNQYATLSSIRSDRIKKLMGMLSGSKGEALSQGEVVSAIYNIIEVDGRILETLDEANDLLFETIKTVAGED
ncbi:MAG: hypothetical protein ACE5HH_04660 [Candidatus Hydrothermarchaeales archaeon]